MSDKGKIGVLCRTENRSVPSVNQRGGPRQAKSSKGRSVPCVGQNVNTSYRTERQYPLSDKENASTPCQTKRVSMSGKVSASSFGQNASTSCRTERHYPLSDTEKASTSYLTKGPVSMLGNMSVSSFGQNASTSCRTERQYPLSDKEKVSTSYLHAWDFNVRTDVIVCDRTRGLYGHGKRVCTES